jgi:hypothetical protein
MTNITKRENELFKRWKPRIDGGFFSDGVPFPDDYEKSAIRTVFVLREPNFKKSERGVSLDLREHLQKADESNWWVQRLSYLCAGITRCWNGTCDSAPSDSPSPVKDLRPFGFIQLKKSPGGGRSICEELRHVATRDKDLIREQLKIYEPQIIIACGLGGCSTFRLLRDTVFCADDRIRPIGTLPPWECLKVIDPQIAPKPFYLLAAYHPSAFVSKEKKLGKLCSDYKTIVSEMEFQACRKPDDQREKK